MNRFAAILLCCLSASAVTEALAGPAQSAVAAIADAKVERTGPAALKVSWISKDPVDVYVRQGSDGGIRDAQLLSQSDADGQHDFVEVAPARSYVLLRDRRSGSLVHVAERLLPLQRGSNFRDIGGYAANGGKHVRWGAIYRSGGTPLLTDDDLARVAALGLKDLVDLRSSEERVLAPTRINGVPYVAVGYPLASLNSDPARPGSSQSMETVYRHFPKFLAPQLRILFAKLVQGETPIAFNCSAGQDRTGFTAALVLTALGVPQDVVVADYQLSTALRHPENEIPPIDAAVQANNPVARILAHNLQDPHFLTPQPLYAADGTAYLRYAFDEIRQRWGSIDAYLDQEIGVTAAMRNKLRQRYLE